MHPGTIRGSITAPPAKSVTQRALLASVIRRGHTILSNTGSSDDERAMRSVIQRLGAVVATLPDGTMSIHSGAWPVDAGAFHFGESGLAIRMAAPVIAALHGGPATLTGEASLLSRPMGWLEQTLPLLGVAVQTTEGRLPATISGRLAPRDLHVDGSLSSQFISGLLFAYAAVADCVNTITVRNPVSRPYLDLTVSVLRDFGFLIVARGHEEFVVYSGNCLPQSAVVEYTVDGDWSSTAIWLAAAASSGGAIAIEGLRQHAAQADRAMLEPLHECGAACQWTGNTLRVNSVEAHTPLRPFVFDATNCPDLFPPLAVLAAACEGVSTIRGVHRLAHKESNRALALQAEFGKMGIQIGLDEQQDAMLVSGGIPKGNVTVHAHGDHRIAMACAALAMRADGPVTVDGANAVAKSYPAFWEDLTKVLAPVV